MNRRYLFRFIGLGVTALTIRPASTSEMRKSREYWLNESDRIMSRPARYLVYVTRINKDGTHVTITGKRVDTDQFQFDDRGAAFLCADKACATKENYVTVCDRHSANTDNVIFWRRGIA